MKYEYKILELVSGIGTMEKLLNELGAQGWELVAVSGQWGLLLNSMKFIFKRAIKSND